MSDQPKTPRTDAVWADIPFFDPKLKTHAKLLEIESDARAERIAELERISSRSELSAVAKLLSFEIPYQASLAKRVETVIERRDDFERRLKISESENAELRQALAGKDMGEPTA